jgi:hypothetical protein
VDTSLFLSFEKVLRVMFLQTAECMWSSTFELRRIAAMVLPLLTEAMFWFKPGSVEVLWQAGLEHPGTALSTACTMSILCAMQLHTRLDQWHGADSDTSLAGSRASPSTDTHLYLARSLAMRTKLVDAIVLRLPLLSAAARGSMTLNQTFVAIEVLLTLLADYHELLDLGDAETIERLCLGRLAEVLLSCHGGMLGKPAQSMLLSLQTQGGALHSANEGLTMADAIRTHVRLVELASPLLPALVDTADLEPALKFVPWLLYCMSKTAIDALHAKNALESLHRVFDRAGAAACATLATDRFDATLTQAGQDAIAVLLGSRDLALDISIVKRAMPCVLTIWLAAPKFKLLVQILGLIAELVPEQPPPPDTRFTSSGSLVPLLLTPESGVGAPFECRSQSSDTDDDERNTSALGPTDADEESDWDSSDDGDELTTVPIQTLCSFMADLTTACSDPTLVIRVDVPPQATADGILAIALNRLSARQRDRIEFLITTIHDQDGTPRKSESGMHRRRKSEEGGSPVRSKLSLG